MADDGSAQGGSEIAVASNTNAVPTPPPHPLDGQWFMQVDGKSYGPFTGHQLRDFARDGRLTRDTDVNRVGSDTWTKASEDNALALVFPAAVTLRPNYTDAPNGSVSAGRGATVVQVTNNIPANQPTVVFESGEAAPKSAGVALLLSILFCGLGQIYNGQVGKGILMFIGCIVLWFVLLGWIINIWSWIDAYQTANAMNERYRRRMTVGAII